MTKKQISLLILLVILFILCIGAAIYFFLNPKNLPKNTLKVDTYQELVDWCDTSTEENKLNISCKALLLEIRTIDANNSCTEVQLITKGKELKNTSICGNESTITYSNDVLNYKKLMPIDINLSYSRTDNLSNFELQNISTTKIDEAYMQNVINEDITNLITIDPNTTTIKNSVDFCPNPDMLPSYVSEKNNSSYKSYYSKNILSQDQYLNLYTEEFENVFLENWEDPAINIFFGCESANRLGYNGICKSTPGDDYENLELSAIPSFVSTWETTENTDNDKITLKNISLVYDGMLYKKTHLNYASPWIIDDLFKFISDANNNQNVYCSNYKIYEQLSQYNDMAKTQLNTIKTLVSNNISQASQVCLETLDKNLYSKEGIYLKAIYVKHASEFYIYDKCNNLYQLMSNE